MFRILIAVLFVTLSTGCMATYSQSSNPNSDFSPSDASGSHPAQMYYYAAELFSEGEKNEAGFWFYAGQLRYRIHLDARPNLPPSGDPALLASLNSVLGMEINGYLGGNPSEWERVIERVLEWDDRTPNDFTPKNQFPEAHARQRAGLESLLREIRKSHDEINRQREQNGLSNR